MSGRRSSFLRWVLALFLGLGPLGANALAALSHASVCTCCRSAAESCCSGEEEAPETPRAVADEDACPCAVIAPFGGTPGAVAPRTECSRTGMRSQLERSHRAVELAWVELALPRESVAAPPGTAPGSGPPGTHVVRGPERAASLGVMRL